MPLRDVWGKIGKVTGQEWADIVRAQLQLIKAQLDLWLRPRGQLLAHAESTGESAATPASRVRTRELEWAVTRAARYGLFRPKCLARSVALHRLLARAGVAGSRIRIGVRQEPDGMTAHAWVTLNGRIVGDTPGFVSRFTEIADAGVARLV